MLAELAPEDSRVLAGGQSLVPMMALRLVDAPHLIDINGLAELTDLAVNGDTLQIGALVRHARFHHPDAAGRLGDLLHRIANYIGHYPVRQRGTFCGSLAHADPASEWCLLAAALEAQVVLKSRSGVRILAAHEYFVGLMDTSRRDDELLAEVRLPVPETDRRFGFFEFSPRPGDFALAASLVSLRVAEGHIVDSRIALGGVEDRPRRFTAAEMEANGKPVDSAALNAAVDCMLAEVEPLTDARSDAPYKLELTRAVVQRAFADALEDFGYPEGPSP